MRQEAGLPLRPGQGVFDLSLLGARDGGHVIRVQPLAGPDQFSEAISDPAQDIWIAHRLNRPSLLLTLCPGGQ